MQGSHDSSEFTMTRRSLAAFAAPALVGILIALLAPLGAGAHPAAARASQRLFPHPVLVGIGEEKPYVFEDPRFTKLGIRHARYDVGWDSMDDRHQTQVLRNWLKVARAHRVVPLITFDQSRRAHRLHVLPSVRDFRHEFRIFRRRFPWVNEFATWNEANLCPEPTCHQIARVVGYWKAMGRECPHCKLLAAELLDVRDASNWMAQFIADAHTQPRYWGLHDYLGANRLDDVSTRAAARVARGEIWLTETAGLVHRRGQKKHPGFPENPAHAARVTGYLLSHMVFVSPRITRIYLYEWNAVNRFDSWDSALIGYNQKPRPAYRVLLRALRARHTHLKVG